MPSAEDEGEEGDDYDLTDKFLADEEDEDKEGSGDEGGEAAKRKRKKRRRSELQLEEEDYDLLEENQVTVRGLGSPTAAMRCPLGAAAPT